MTKPAYLVSINGKPVKVFRTLSCGPECEPHTFELSNGDHCYVVAGVWKLQRRGQQAYPVAVSYMRATACDCGCGASQ